MDQELKTDLSELFFKMEEDHALFDLRTKEGFPIWDVVRNPIWWKIIYEDKKNETSIKIWNKILSRLKAFILFPLLFLNRKKFFFFGASRFPNSKGEFYDPYFEEVKESLTNNYIFFETITGKDKYVQKKHTFPILPYLIRFLNPFIVNLKLEQKNIPTFDKIASACNTTFEGKSITSQEITQIYTNFLVEYYFYKYLFKLMPSIKILFLHQNGFQKGLILGSQSNNVKVMEFQHADIVEANIVWHYGFNKFKSKNDIIFPDVFLTFSEVWSSNCHIPCSTIEIGCKHYNIDKVWIPDSKTIGIISTQEHEDALNNLVVKAAKSNLSTNFLYKLHPAQFARYHEFVLYFQDLPNVKVFPVESTVKDLIYQANEFIVIYSSVIFELLQSGKIVYIYKKLNYWFFKRYFKLANVYLFEDVEDLNLLRKNAEQSNVSDLTVKFFKPFNAPAFKSLVENL
jgi:hypothetical protein